MSLPTSPNSPDHQHDVKSSVSAWFRRLSKPVNPLADLVYSDQASEFSFEDAQFLTAAPNTPLSISFPEVDSPSTTPAELSGRTPKSSISNESEKTAVASPASSPKKLDAEDIEAFSKGGATYAGASIPLALRKRVALPLWLAMVACAAGLMTALILNVRDKGWAVPVLVKYAEAQGYKHLFFTIPPIIISTLFSMSVSWTESEVRQLQPLVNLSKRHSPGLPERTLLLDYAQRNVFTAFYFSLRRDPLVAVGTFIGILSLTLNSLAGALFTVREVVWQGPDVMVNTTSKVGLNRAADFMDMTSFQAASSFASADVIYNLTSLPFVAGGYTVAAFELPKVQMGTNGSVQADRAAVLSQAACVAPDSLAMVNEQSTPLVWHNTALFGQCEYTWTIASNATYLYGLASADFAGCGQDFGLIPLQYRPVLFWFFTYKPEPTASIVLCTPHAFPQNVSVSIDLATQAMAVTPLQSSPDDTSVTNLGPFAYNGVFFQEDDLDQTALARLQGIQQQLPGAVFEAARTKDPLLRDTFNSHGFTRLAQDVYTTYLSLVAKSVYFIDDHTLLSVSVSSNCKRFFIVRVAAIALSGVLGTMSLLWALLHCLHRRARRGLRLPPRLGTLGAAVWLTAQTDVALALAHAEKGDIAGALAGHRYFVDDVSGRILRVPDVRPPREPKAMGRMRRWISSVGRACSAVGRMLGKLSARKAASRASGATEAPDL